MQQKLLDALQRYKIKKKVIPNLPLINIFHSAIIEEICFGDKIFITLNDENSLIFCEELIFNKAITESYNIYHEDDDIFLYDYENNGKYLSAISMYILENKVNNDIFILFAEMYLQEAAVDITGKTVYEVTDILISGSYYDTDSKPNCKNQYFKYNTFAIARIELISSYVNSDTKSVLEELYEKYNEEIS